MHSEIVFVKASVSSINSDLSEYPNFLEEAW